MATTPWQHCWSAHGITPGKKKRFAVFLSTCSEWLLNSQRANRFDALGPRADLGCTEFSPRAQPTEMKRSPMSSKSTSLVPQRVRCLWVASVKKYMYRSRQEPCLVSNGRYPRDALHLKGKEMAEVAPARNSSGVYPLIETTHAHHAWTLKRQKRQRDSSTERFALTCGHGVKNAHLCDT